MMPLRFLIALSSKPAPEPEACSIFRSPTKVPDAAPAIWCEAKTPVTPMGDDGLLLGYAFSGSSPLEAHVLAEMLSHHSTAEAMARCLADQIWGGYVAILRCQRDRQWRIFCDPSGLVPVMIKERDGTFLFASDADLLFRVGVGQATVCFETLVSHLRRPELSERTTCLAGIEELEPGTLFAPSDSDSTVTPIWRASDYISYDPKPDIGQAAARLRKVAVETMEGWAKVLGKVAVATSGGVDSSLICAALAQAFQPFDCITVSTQDRAGDESSFAAAVAGAFAVRCTVRVYDPARYDPRRTASEGLARPARRSFVTVFDDLLREAMDELGASVVLDGNGGDNIFCFLHSAAPVFDRLQHDGPGFGVWRTLLDMCRITGCSAPTLAMATVRRFWRRGAADPWPADERFLQQGKVDLGSAPLRSWIDAVLDQRSGGYAHLSLIAHAQNQIHPLTCRQHRFSPLHSQPMLECCLGLPSWIWAAGGINRAPARLAFSQELPPPVTRRVSKAGPDSFVRLAFARNRATITQRLLEGLLAQHRVIDRYAVEQAMAVDEVTDGSTIERLLDLLEAENWARSWSG
ncbi:asparagine synthase-related protein [Qipengyuania qiaonensis]|uniref:asparagine synthase (glutamine-hydrolyzing) n=1 Tax=Qipengyuania qiaonensis TaxID=2867240 RepID=A0ABS7J7S3_9SPHN|nr:asparagine synthase-related protein [Qipengyuania qiaonensis]MBX7481678.1 hypothetical protein [Qipengyuania qiaonensis]